MVNMFQTKGKKIICEMQFVLGAPHRDGPIHNFLQDLSKAPDYDALIAELKEKKEFIETMPEVKEKKAEIQTKEEAKTEYNCADIKLEQMQGEGKLG